MNERPTPETDAEVTSYFEKKHPPIVCYHELAKFARRLERERDEARDDARVLLKEIFNLTQIGDPHPAGLPMKALQAIAEMIDEQWKGQSK